MLKLRIKHIVSFFILFMCSVSAIASESTNDYSHLSDEQFKTLISIKNSFASIDHFLKINSLTAEQAEGARTYILYQQQSLMDEPLPHAKLRKLVISCMQDELCREQSIMARFRGIFNFVNIMWFLASVLILAGFIAILSIYKRFIFRILRPVTRLLHSVLSFLLPMVVRFFQRLPFLLYQFIALFCATMVVYVAKFSSEASHAYIAFMGNVLVMLVLSFIFKENNDDIRKFYKKHYSFLRHKPKTLLMFLSCTVWAISAIFYDSQLLGFFTIAQLLIWLGFGFEITPLMYSFGFHKGKSIISGTFGAFVLLFFYIITTINQVHIPYYATFETGVKYLGSFVFYIGLLIASNKWACRYYKFNYLLLQIVTIISGLAALYIGSVFELSVLQGIGGTFFVLYIIEKQFEFPWDKKRAAWLLLLLGISLYFLTNIVTLYPEYFFMSVMPEE